jgi:hypothetical protein
MRLLTSEYLSIKDEAERRGIPVRALVRERITGVLRPPEIPTENAE